MAYVPSRGQYKGQSFQNRYQYRKYKLQQQFGVTPRQYTKIRKSSKFQEDFRSFQARGNKKDYTGFFKNFVTTRGKSDESLRLVSDSVTRQAFENYEIESQEITLKEYLELIGRREPGDPWEVGETPKVESAA